MTLSFKHLTLHKPAQLRASSPGLRQIGTATATAAPAALALDLLVGARHAALAVIDPGSGTPGISRIALGLDPDGLPLSLISTLARHTAALRANPAAALMVGEPGPRGDPLTHPRLMIEVRASFPDRTAPDYALLAGHWLDRHPKAKLYIDFTDFALVRLTPVAALLNGGFGKAFRLTPDDLRPAQ